MEYEAPEIEEAEEEKDETHPLYKNLDKGNIVDQLKDNTAVYNDVIELYNTANESMGPWIKKYDRAIKLAKLQPTAGDKDIETKSFPFEGASLAMLPYILESALDFNSRAAPELVWAEDLVKTKVYGRNNKIQIENLDQEDQQALDQTNKQIVEPAEKQTKSDRGDRVSKYMNYQVNEQIPFWRTNQDKALMMLPIVGTFYKKTYWDRDLKGICSELVTADKVIFDMSCDNFESCPNKFLDITVTRNELISYIRGEQKWQMAEKDLIADKKSFDFIEAYTYIDIDDDGVSSPYVAILDKETLSVVCLYPNYDEEGIHTNDEGELVKVEESECFTQYRFLPDPEGGPMGLGWGILLGPMFTAINTNVRQLLDAGTLSITAANSGLIVAGVGKGRGNRQDDGPIEVQLGQLTTVNLGGINGSLRDNIVQMPFAGPNPVLMQLMEYLINSARAMTTAAMSVEPNPGEAASLYLARLNQALKVPNSIIARVHDCAKAEFKKIHILDFKYHDSKAYNRVLDEQVEYVMQDDFNPEDCDIRLAGNPAQGSDEERIARAELNLQMAERLTASGQQIMNLRQAVIDLLEATKCENIDELVPEPSNEVDPQMKIMLAEKQMEAELKKKDQELREKGQQIQQAKLELEVQRAAMTGAKEMTALGLEGDFKEAEITKKYVESIEKLVNLGMGFPQAVNAIQSIENRFIDAEGGNNNAVPPSNPNPSGAMAPRPSNPGAIQLPRAVPGGS